MRLFITLSYFIIMLVSTSSSVADSKIVSFNSSDNILISADIYSPHQSSAPIVVLFHQAGSSRGEYNEIAPRLNTLGFNCLAVDLRSGEFSRGKDNQTAMRASNAGLSTSYSDARPDIISALEYTQKKYPDSKILAWGSSYSAALVLKVAGDHPELIDGVLAFSPGEYFSHQGKSKTWIRDSAKNINIPVFITSSKKETESWQEIFDVIPSNDKNSFIPVTEGRHGSRALWKKYNDSESYWRAIKQFLLSKNRVWS